MRFNKPSTRFCTNYLIHLGNFIKHYYCHSRIHRK
jgi:hypothetical protein